MRGLQKGYGTHRTKHWATCQAILSIAIVSLKGLLFLPQANRDLSGGDQAGIVDLFLSMPVLAGAIHALPPIGLSHVLRSAKPRGSGRSC
jgi:hypothetical protein